MTKRIPKRLAVLGAGLLLLIGGGAAVAASSAGSDEFLADVAKRLGVSQTKLEQAIVDSRKAQVDAAVADGRITKAEADRIKERLAAGDVGPGFGGFEPGGHGPGHHGLGGLEEAATYLDLTEAELREALVDGKSLADVAKAEGKTVAGLKAALVAAHRARLDEAVADGRLTKARADALKEQIADHVDEQVERSGFGRPGVGRHGFGGHGFGPSGPSGFAPTKR